MAAHASSTFFFYRTTKNNCAVKVSKGIPTILTVGGVFFVFTIFSNMFLLLTDKNELCYTMNCDDNDDDGDDDDDDDDDRLLLLLVRLGEQL